MNTTPQPPEPDKNLTPEEIEADIAATRERLAEDVEALAAKADIPGQAKARIEETRRKAGHVAHQVQDQATQTAQSLPRPALIALPTAIAAILALIIIIATRRRST
jgi:hypothetical protein